MGHILLSSTVLIPSPKLKQSFDWVGNLNLSNDLVSNKIDVILFRCDSITEIRVVIERDIRELKGLPENFKICKSIAYLEHLLEQMSQRIYCKELDQALLETIAIKLQLPLSNENIIYLSSVRGVSN